jgi:molecular chaperone DnaK (HSP70)
MSRILGIDLGTTNSVAAYMTKGVATPVGFTANDQIFPSVVSIERSGKFEVGTKAKNSQRSKIYSAKRFIGRRFADNEVQQALATMDLPYEVTEGADGDVRLSVDGREFSPIEIGALVLRKIKEAAEAQQGEFPRAIITVPAYFRESQVAATREAGRLAGFHVVQIINEPTAAALAFGVANAADAEGKIIVIYDFGGGTFDVSLLMPVAGSYTVLDVGGDAFLGGDNIDNKMMRRVHEATLKEQGIDIFAGSDAAKAKANLKAKVEEAKIGLSTSFEEAIDVPALNGANVYYTFRRDDLEQMIAPLVEQSIDITLQTLNNKGFSPSDVEMVVLVGGTTQIPLIRRRLAETFGEQKLQTNINPMLCVAEGAAVLSAVIQTIDCVSCMTSNDIESTKCGKCGASLLGSGNPIGDMMGDRLSTPLPIAKNFEKASGLKCMECGNVCPPGAKVCPKCNANLAVKETIDITAHPIGIELVDGSFAKIIDAGTHFPMNENRAETFRTAMDNQPRLEVNVFEGSKNTAAENEFLGSIDIPLLTSYPKGTPIEVALKLDRSRTTEVSVRVGGRNEAPHIFRLQRSVLSPEIKDGIIATRQEIFAFLDRWKDETVPAEQIALKEHIGTLDGFLSSNAAVGKSKQDIETQVKAGKDLLEICTSARGTCAALSNAIHGLQGIVPQDQLHTLQEIHDELMQARTHGRWEALPPIVEHADGVIENVGSWRAMLLAENFLAQRLLSATVASRVQNSVETIRRGAANNNPSQIDSGFDSLDAVWPAMSREIETYLNIHRPKFDVTRRPWPLPNPPHHLPHR